MLSAEMFNGKSFTFELWFNPVGPGVLIGEVDSADVSRWDVALAEILPDGQLKVGVPGVPTITAGVVSFGKWSYLAVVYDEANQTLNAYIDGVLSGTSGGTRNAPRDGGRVAVYTMGRGGPANLGGGEWYSGAFEEVRIWRVALDAARISSYWNRILSPEFEGLRAIWHFDISGGNISPDSHNALNPVLYVPVDGQMLFVPSNAPLLSIGPGILTKSAIVTDRTVMLQGAAHPHGLSASIFFEWGLTAAYGEGTETNSIDAAITNITDFSVTLTNLLPGTYHFRAVGLADGSVFYGADSIFAVVGPSAVAQTPYISANSAQLFGVVNPKGFETTALFEWGSSTEYGNSTTPVAFGGGASAVNFGAFLPNLAPGTYHFRPVAIFEQRRTNGLDSTFSILSPTNQTRGVTISGNTVTLQAFVSPVGVPIIQYFEWGISTLYGNRTPPRPLELHRRGHFVSESLVGLAPGEYHYRSILSNATTHIVGVDQTFIIGGQPRMSAQLTGSDFIRTSLSSDLMFEGNENNISVQLWFKAAEPSVLVSEVDAVDDSKWDFALAEILPDGVIRVSVPGVPAFIVATTSFNVWRHLTLVYDNQTQVLSAYMEGVLAGTSSGERETPAEAGRNAFLCFGRASATNFGGGTAFVGSLDEIRIWSRPLSGEEVAINYDQTLAPSSGGASLWADWHFDAIESVAPEISEDFSGKMNFAIHVGSGPFVLDTPSPAGASLPPIMVAGYFHANSAAAIEFEAAVNPSGMATAVYFEYGRSNIFHQTLPQQIGDGHFNITVKELIQNLEIGSDYQVRAIASNAFGRAVSATRVVTPAAWPGISYLFNGTGMLATEPIQNPLFTNKDITIELWFRPAAAGVLASETTVNFAYDRSILEVLASGEVLAVFDGLLPISLGIAQFNQWNHVAVRYDSLTQTLDGFLNGFKSEARSGVRTSFSERKVEGRFAFARRASTKLGTGAGFNGHLDEIRIWNRVRSDEDLTVGRFNLLAGDEFGLVLNWRLNLADVGRVLDSSSLLNQGLPSGAIPQFSDAPLVYNVRRSGDRAIETQFVVRAGSTYRLESTFDFIQWLPILTNTASSSGFLRFPQMINMESTGAFFRVVPQ